MYLLTTNFVENGHNFVENGHFLDLSKKRPKSNLRCF